MKTQMYESLLETMLKSIPILKQSSNEQHQRFDNIVVWIVALTTGVLVLIFSQYKNISFIPNLYLKISVLLFMLTIISGVVHRVYASSFHNTYNNFIVEFFFVARGVL